jgi:prepilin-type N-terminal cleavage/methylation domain-containing protein
MTRPLSRSFGQRGFTVIEMLMTTGVVGITGTIMYYILYTGMILFAKNTAINLAHQQARIAVMQMEQDIHAAVSVPQMTDTNRVALTGAQASGPAAGISFQLFASGPFQVAAAAAAGQSQIQIQTNGIVPVVNQRLIIPTHQIELNITAVSAGGTNSTLTLASPLPVAVQTSLGSPAVAVNVQCFITDRVAYVVQNNQLVYYGRQTTNTFKVMANDITTTTPFSVPATPLGAPYTRFVAAINLSTADTAYSNLNFKAANMFLNAMEPCRAQLCAYQ